MISRLPFAPILCLVTNRNICDPANLCRDLEAAIGAGINMVQIREKDLSGKDLLSQVRQFKRCVKDNALLIVNERVDIALLGEADGVHLGENGISIPDARRIAGESFLIGKSVHSLDGAIDAEQSGADYLIVGTVFSSITHMGEEAQGIDLLKKLGARIEIPYIAIGGMNRTNVRSVIESGASGVAVMRSILASTDRVIATSNIRSAMVID
jgi:thiamine-phosphate pyrophosphorylase